MLEPLRDAIGLLDSIAPDRSVLDGVPGGARVVDPIISGFTTGRHVWGQFLKDHSPTDW